MGINKKLLPIKGHYFLFNAGTAPLVPYLSSYARQLGFSSYIVGIIYTVLPVAGLIAKPLFGAIADRFKKQKALLILFALITCITFLSIYFIPQSVSDISVEMACIDESAHMKTCYTSEEAVNTCLVDRIKNDTGYGSCQLSCSTNHTSIINPSDDQLHFEVSVPLGQTVLQTPCVYFAIGNNSVEQPHCDITFTGSVFLNDSILGNCSLECDSSMMNEVFGATYDGSADITQVFALFFALMIANWVGQAVVVSVADAVCFDLLENQPSLYGKQRLWGSIGWGTFSLMTGVLIDSTSGGSIVKNYTIAFVLSFVLMLADAVCCAFLKIKPTRESISIVKDVGILLTSPHVLLFLVWTIGVGLCTGLQWQFLFWHIEDVAASYSCESQAWTKTIQGAVSAMQTFGGEIPFLFISGPILKYCGHQTMMSIVMLAFGLRFICYSFLTNPWWVLPIELFQGITFGMFYPTLTSYASVVALPGTETTVQGMVGAIYEGIGASLGSYIGGLLYEKHTGWKTFEWFGIGALVFCAVHFAAQTWVNKYCRRGTLIRTSSENKVNFNDTT